MKIGCQTFTWEMLGSAYGGGVEDMVDAIADAGYAGVEISNVMIGGYDRDPAGLKALLTARNLEFVAYAFSVPGGFTVAAEADGDIAAAADALEFLSSFPGAVLSLGCPTDTQGIGDVAAIRQAAKLFNKVGALGQALGIPVAVHPSSHHGSAVVTRPQYERLMAETDPALIRWVPDTGHIIRGRQDIRETLSLFADRIIYVHLKDADRAGTWQMMGQGDCGIPDVVSHLRSELGFDGWLVAEEESKTAKKDPGAAIRANREFLRAVIPN